MRTRLVPVMALAALLAVPIAPEASVAPWRSLNGVPVAPAGVGALASTNIELLATIPDAGMTGGRFAAGYFFTTISGSGAFEPNPNSGFRIYDAKNPELPILVGTLALPHAENEDVDISVSRKLALISYDTISKGQGLAGVAVSKKGPQYIPGDKLYVVSWANPAEPELLGTLVLPEKFKSSNGKSAGGPGHITNCIDDCKRYAYVTGASDGSIFVIDLKDPERPSIAANLPPSLIKAAGPGGKWVQGTVHDVNVDQYGQIWMTGVGGTAVFDARNPLKPKPLKWIGRQANEDWNQFIHHNSLRLDKNTVLVTEEDWLQPNCKRDQAVGAGNFQFKPGEQGGFQTWSIDPKRNGENSIRHLDQWLPELEQYGSGSSAVNIFCSSHWFTFNRNKIVAVAWYGQGVRFLDVSKPKDIRQVGYWLGPASQASAAYFAPGRDDIVWIADYNRGLDVVRINGGGKNASTVIAPLRAEWFAAASSAATKIAFEPHPVFGWACPVPRRPDALK